jgi:hypothetical protein
LFWRAGVAYSLFGAMRLELFSDFGERKADMKTVVLCVQCDKPERECTCDRYCCYCQGLEGIRFCADGKYYCPDCREACEIRVADPNDA